MLIRKAAAAEEEGGQFSNSWSLHFEIHSFRRTGVPEQMSSSRTSDRDKHTLHLFIHLFHLIFTLCFVVVFQSQHITIMQSFLHVAPCSSVLKRPHVLPNTCPSLCRSPVGQQVARSRSAVGTAATAAVVAAAATTQLARGVCCRSSATVSVLCCASMHIDREQPGLHSCLDIVLFALAPRWPVFRLLTAPVRRGVVQTTIAG